MPGLPYPLPSMPPAPRKRQGLLIKLSLLLLASALLPLLLLFFSGSLSNTTLLQLAVILFFILTGGVFFIRRFLNPLDKLIKGLEVQSGDEFETLSETFNRALYNLNQTASSKESLAAAEAAELNIIFASISEGIIVLDLNYNVVLMNKAAEKITAHTLPEAKNQPADSILQIKDGQNTILSARDYCPKYSPEGANLPQTFSAVKIINRQQEEIQADISAAPISEAVQTNLGWIIIVRDLTQKQNLEQMQIDFVSMASHEIRTPLTTIISYLSTISEESEGKIEPELKVFLDRALLSAKQLSVLTANLLNVSKIERGSFTMFLQPLDWKKRVTEAVENLRPQALQKNITLTLNFPPENLPSVSADNIRINEVINNLVSNAINYSPQNGNINITVALKDHEVITSVADKGPGIPKDALPHLFTKFFRVAGSLEQMQKGTGLGLYLSKSIIDLHHGKIWAESEVGKGSTFSFSLPVASANSDQPTIAQLLHTSSPQANP